MLAFKNQSLLDCFTPSIWLMQNDAGGGVIIQVPDVLQSKQSWLPVSLPTNMRSDTHSDEAVGDYLHKHHLLLLLYSPAQVHHKKNKQIVNPSSMELYILV